MSILDNKENLFYNAPYVVGLKFEPNKYWEYIRNNKELLKWAITLTKNKYGESTVNEPTICEYILVDSENVDSSIYYSLINRIYSDKHIARKVLNGYSNGGFSYLLLSLQNPKLKLTEEQKAFAVNEAMNKYDTVRNEAIRDVYSKLKNGLSYGQTIYLNVDGSIYPIGAKTGHLFFAGLTQEISNAQSHGFDEYDIRYWILKNPNWSIEEKRELIMAFWSDDKIYDETLEQWEWGIINDPANYKGDSLAVNAPYEIYNCSYEELLEFFGDENKTNIIWEEIQFCRKMRELRKPQSDLEYEAPSY